jgi:hypothetical protein
MAYCDVYYKAITKKKIDIQDALYRKAYSIHFLEEFRNTVNVYICQLNFRRVYNY